MYNEIRMPNFEERPIKEIKNSFSVRGYSKITRQLNKGIDTIAKEKKVIVFDYYHGVDEQAMLDNVLRNIGNATLIDSSHAKYSEDIIMDKFGKYITDDRIFGVYCWEIIDACFDPIKVKEIRDRIEEASGLVILYGVASSIITRGDILVYCNISYQEINKRYMEGLDNWGAKNHDEDYERKLKRGTFFEFVMQDRHKRPLLKECDYMIDCNDTENPVLVTGEEFRNVLTLFASTPFKAVTAFIPSVWGGDWCKKVLDCGKDLVNTGWGMNGFLEVQSVLAKVGDNVMEFPSTDIYNYNPKETLGKKIFYLYGYCCPLHVNFLDTYRGGNLSLQVHPTTSYSQEVFNAKYGHFESYYILDATEESLVYLGTKDGVKKDELIEAFEKAQETNEFDDEKYINKFPVKRHDHIFIPAGTIHSSGINTLVLEIDMTTFATFKLWDWNRVDLDGRPRPINIDHGKHNIQEEFQTTLLKDMFISKKQEIGRGHGWVKEHSGTMPFEAPIKVDRYWFNNLIYFETNDCIIIHVLVDGEEAIVESMDGEFEPMVFHFAEAVFVPASVGHYTIRPFGRSEGKQCAVLEIYMNI
ncbi:MAG: hypothetical protein EWM47_08225 [Anaerolineaceae bacterium]|nr:MAG: hypothetical protein EWM47_08225 [Anaerolineaceae bacterium]